MAIFDKNHGLTRLENFDIFDFFKTSFSMSTRLQNILLYPEYHETVFLVLFCGKKTVLPSPLRRRFVVGTRFGFLHHWKALRRFTFLEEKRI